MRNTPNMPTEDNTTINYLVISYFDLWDVVQTIENMIKTNSGMTTPGVCRNNVKVAIVSLGSGKGFMLSATLPKSFLGYKL
jgi:hypothetical protein